jgi:GT2 family glycosyltransferase
MLPHTFVHLVTYQSTEVVLTCVDSLLSQEGFSVEQNLTIHITDNGSVDALREAIANRFDGKVKFQRNLQNMGFCAAHNQGAYQFLEGSGKYFLVLNPDVRLAPSALACLISTLEQDSTAGMGTPLLLRADSVLAPIVPSVVDAAGVVMSSELRHFDRGAEKPYSSQYETPGYVFGGTGACLLLRRDCLLDLLVSSEAVDEALYSLYPQLRDGLGQRKPLFDEAFFAYREDADLAWRAQLLGWKTRFVPQALVYHERRVTPERRSKLPAFINKLGVRNRFLLQFNNLTVEVVARTFFRGVVLRNLLVIVAVLVRERSSLSGLREVFKLYPRARYRRSLVLARARERFGGRLPVVAHWFGKTEIEHCEHAT